MSDENTNTSSEHEGKKARYFNAVFTTLLALAIFAGGIFLIWSSNSSVATDAIEDLAILVENGNLPANSKLHEILDGLVSYELFNIRNFFLGGILLCIGMTMLFARLFEVNAKASGGLKIGPLELPIQITGTVALLFFLLFGFAGISGFFGLHKPRAQVQDALNTVNTATAKMQSQRFEELNTTIKNIALSREFKVEFALLCKDSATGNSQRIDFVWQKDSAPNSFNGLIVDKSAGIGSPNPDFVKISLNTPSNLSFEIDGKSTALVSGELDEETGNFRVLIAPNLSSIGNTGIHSMTSYCNSLLPSAGNSEASSRTNSDQRATPVNLSPLNASEEIGVYR